MNDRLCAVVDKVEQLPDAEQATLIAMIEEELEELEWDALTQKPGARAFHDQLRAELRQAEEYGELEEIV